MLLLILSQIHISLKAAWRQFFNATWKDFQESSKSILNDMTHHRELIERGASLEQIQESRDARLQFQASFDAVLREQNLAKKIAVINWLSAADAALDQESCTSARYDIHESGRWILREPKIKEWLDPADSSVPIFWLSGIPGAGKLEILAISSLFIAN
jgi:hypothetical protein